MEQILMELMTESIISLFGLNRISVSKKLLGLSLLFIGIFTSTISYTFITLDKQKSDGQVINIAGRQRMLTQKYTKEFFLALHYARSNQTEFNMQQFDKTRKLFELSLKALKEGGTTYLDLGMTKAIELPATNNKAINEKLSQVLQIWRQLQSMIDAIDINTADNQQLDQVNQLSIKTLATMNQAVVMFASDSDANVQSMLSNQKWIWFIVIVILSVFSTIISKNIVKPLTKVVQAAQRITEGDLKTYPSDNKQKDELGNLLKQVNNMRSVLSDIIHTVQQNSKQMSHSSMQIATISQEISTISKQEQQGSEKVLLATSSLQNITNDVLEHIEITSKMAEQTHVTANDGEIVVKENIKELEQVVLSVDDTAEQMASVKLATDKIHQIISAINDIAEQTNLLALNAAIEAARAGENGRGFAVVADEVRNLAARTASSTGEITELIGSLTTSVDNSVSSMQQVTEQVAKSQSQSQSTLTAFDSMKAGIIENNDNFNHIMGLNLQQTEQLASLQTELEQLFNILEESAEKAGSTSLVASDLHSVSDKLEVLLGEFDTDNVKPSIREPNEKRLHPRIDNQIKVELSQGDDCIEGLTKDISLSGLHVKCAGNQHLPLNKNINVRIYMPKEKSTSKQQSIDITGKIIREEHQATGYYYGLTFNHIDKQTQDSLQHIFDYFAKASHYA